MLNSSGDKGHPRRTPCPMTQQPDSSPSILTTALCPKYNFAIKFLYLQSTPISFNIHIIFLQSTLSNAFSSMLEMMDQRRQWKHQTTEEARQQYLKLNNRLCKIMQAAKEQW